MHVADPCDGLIPSDPGYTGTRKTSKHRTLPIVGSMLAQRRRRWASIERSFDERLVFSKDIVLG